MPRTQRSPPITPTLNQRVRSSPEISGDRGESGFDLANVTTRNINSKRLRPNFSPDGKSDEQSPSQTFEKNIRELLTTWKTDQDVTLQRWKSEQDAILKTLSSDIAEVKLQYITLTRINGDIEKSMEFISKEYESMRLLLTKLEKEQSDQRSYITELEKKVEDLQRSRRSSALEIRNVPIKEKETISDLTSVVDKTCNVIHVDVPMTQIRDIYRLPGRQEINRPIVVEFQTVSNRNKILEACRAYNKGRAVPDRLNTNHLGITGVKIPIYVGEHQPASVRKLFNEARTVAKSHNFKYCWFQNGNVFLREKDGEKAILVRSSNCLQKIGKTT